MGGQRGEMAKVQIGICLRWYHHHAVVGKPLSKHQVANIEAVLDNWGHVCGTITDNGGEATQDEMRCTWV